MGLSIVALVAVALGVLNALVHTAEAGVDTDVRWLAPALALYARGHTRVGLAVIAAYSGLAVQGTALLAGFEAGRDAAKAGVPSDEVIDYVNSVVEPRVAARRAQLAVALGIF